MPLLPEIVLGQAHADLYRLWDRLGTLPFWAYPWPGGQALARYLLDHPDAVRGRRVLDVACGSGLLAITASVAGATAVTALDVDPLALCATALNAAANDVCVHVLQADVLEIADLPVGEDDVVLAGDVLYEPDLAAAMLSRLQRAEANGAQVLVGAPRRPVLRSGTVLDGARVASVGQYDVPVHPDLERGPVLRTDVVRLAAR